MRLSSQSPCELRPKLSILVERQRFEGGKDGEDGEDREDGRECFLIVPWQFATEE